MRYLEDLRFVIGAFFAIVSLILLAVGLVNGTPPTHGINLNLMTGAAMGIFSVAMIGLAVLSKPEEEESTAAEGEVASSIVGRTL